MTTGTLSPEELSDDLVLAMRHLQPSLAALLALLQNADRAAESRIEAMTTVLERVATALERPAADDRIAALLAISFDRLDPIRFAHSRVAADHLMRRLVDRLRRAAVAAIQNRRGGADPSCRRCRAVVHHRQQRRICSLKVP